VCRLHRKILAKAPGVTLLTDAAGDSLSPEPGTDMLAASVAQQNGTSSSRSIPIRSLASQHPIGSAWYLAMKVPGATAGTFRYTGVRMEFTGAGPHFLLTRRVRTRVAALMAALSLRNSLRIQRAVIMLLTGQIIIVVKPE
jgi:hypothetical protein